MQDCPPREEPPGCPPPSAHPHPQPVFSGCPTPVAVSSSVSSLNLPSAHPPSPPAAPAQPFLPIPPHPSSLPDASPHYLMLRMWKKIAVTSSPDFLHSISRCLPLCWPMLARSIRPELALCHSVTQARTTGSLFPCRLKIKRLSKALEALQRPVLTFYLFLSCPSPPPPPRLDIFTPAGKIAPCGPSITMNVNPTNPLCTSPLKFLSLPQTWDPRPLPQITESRAPPRGQSSILLTLAPGFCSPPSKLLGEAQARAGSQEVAAPYRPL